MEVFVFRITTDYYIHTEAENYLLAYQFQKKNKTDNFLQHVRLDTAKSVCQLMKQEDWVLGCSLRFHFFHPNSLIFSGPKA